MRNLKKSLALVLVFAMAMATVAGAAFADVPADHAFNEEIEALTGLDILQGMGNDNFAPDGTLTRAQAAAVIYRSLTGRSSADVHQTATAFSDVAGNFWGAGYINYCSDLGVINGYPDGTFKPDSPVTYAEFTKMIVVALGADAGKNLVYPTGYIATAEMYKVLEDISFVPGAPAKRADIAKIAYNAIFEAPYARKMIPGTVYEAGKEPKIAVDVLQLGKSKVTITGIGKNYGDTSDKEDEVKLTNIDAKGYDKFPNGKAIYTGKLDPSQLGLSAIVYWKVINGDTKAYSITVEDSNKIVTKKAKDLKKLGSDNKVTWKADGKDKEYTIDSSAKFYVNNKEVNAANFYKFISTTAGLNLDVSDGKIGACLVSFDFINTDNNDDFEVVKATKYNVYTVQSVDAKAVYTKEGTTLYLQDKNSDANPVTYPKDLKKDDIIFVYADLAYDEVNTDAKDLKAEIKLCETKTDVLFAGSDDKDVIFGGTTYILSKNFKDNFVGTNFDVTNATGKYDITVDPIFGYVVKAEGSEAATEYFLVTAAENNSFSGNRIKGYNNEGKELTYKMKSGIDYATKVDTAIFTNSTSAVTISTPVITRISVNKDGQVTEIKNAYTDLIETGKDAKFEDVTTSALLNKDSYKASSKLLTTKNISGSTVTDVKTFKVDSSSVFFFKDPNKDDYYAFVGKFPSIGTITEGDIYYKESEGDKVITSAYLVGKPSGTSSEFSNIIGYVISNDLRVNSDEDYYRVVKIMAKGEIKTYETETYTSSGDAALEGGKAKFVKFDLTTDGKIANDGANAFEAVGGYLFGNETATDEKAMIAVSTSDNAIGYEAGNVLDSATPVATNYIKIDANTKFMIADKGDADDSEIGTVGSVITRIINGTRDGSNVLAVFEDEDETKVAKFVFIIRDEDTPTPTPTPDPIVTGIITYIDAANKAVDKVTVAAGTALDLDVKFNNTTDKNISIAATKVTGQLVDENGASVATTGTLMPSTAFVALAGKTVDLGTITNNIATAGTYTIIVSVEESATVTHEAELTVTVTASVADATAAKAVVDEITALGATPTKAAVTTANGNYTGLSSNAKTLVTNYATLKAFVDDIAAGVLVEAMPLTTNKEVKDARAAYDVLGALGKAEVTVANITSAETALANAKTALANKIAEAKPVYTAEKATLDSLTPVEVSAISANTAGAEPAAYNALVSALGAEITTAEGFNAEADAATAASIGAVTTALDGDLTAVTGAKAAFDAEVATVRP